MHAASKKLAVKLVHFFQFREKSKTIKAQMGFALDQPPDGSMAEMKKQYVAQTHKS